MTAFVIITILYLLQLIRCYRLQELLLLRVLLDFLVQLVKLQHFLRLFLQLSLH